MKGYKTYKRCPSDKSFLYWGSGYADMIDDYMNAYECKKCSYSAADFSDVPPERFNTLKFLLKGFIEALLVTAAA